MLPKALAAGLALLGLLSAAWIVGQGTTVLVYPSLPAILIADPVTPLATVTLLPTVTPLASPAQAIPLAPNRTPTAVKGVATSARIVVVPTPANTLNGIALDRILVLSAAVRQRARQVYGQGQAQGRNPRAFSKVGDSTMVWPPLLAVFDAPAQYRLGGYSALQATITRFAGSFGRASIAAKNGMHSWSEFDPAWADPARCKPDEGPLACEFRLNNPSLVLIRLGANDVNSSGLFNEQMRRIVEFCMARGAIPVLGTKPDRLDADNALNKLVYKMASDYAIPLWDYDLIAGTVPGKGLQSDRVHYLGGGSRDYGSPSAFRSADSLEDFTALLMLDALSREVGPPGAVRP